MITREQEERRRKKEKVKRERWVQETNQLLHPSFFSLLYTPELYKLKAKLSTLRDARNACACIGAKKLVGKNLRSLFRSLARLNTRVLDEGPIQRKPTTTKRQPRASSARRTRRRVGKEGWTRNGLAVPDCPLPLPAPPPRPACLGAVGTRSFGYPAGMEKALSSNL